MAIILTTSLFAQVVSAQSSYPKPSITFSSFGVISSPPLPPPIQSELLPLTGFGGDYLLTFDGGDPDEVWLEWGWVDQAASRLPGYHTSKLGFVFPGLTGQSVLDYDKMDRVLEIFASRGLKVVLSFHNNNEECAHYVAQSGFVNNWVALANHYKNSPLRNTIAAYNIFGEPRSDFVGDYPSLLALQQRFAYTIQQIHAVDPTMPVVFPNGDQIYNSAQQHISDIKSTGIDNDPYVIFDTTHPYFFPPPYEDWNKGMTPEQKASWYMSNWVQPYINAFGASRCWCGETFHWGVDSVALDALQSRWLVAIINDLHGAGVGFNFLSCLGVGGFSGFAKTLNDVDNSNYDGTLD